MNKTDTKKVLDIIEEAKIEIMTARGDADKKTNELLEGIGIVLDQIERELIIDDLKSKVNKLTQSSAKLSSINQEAIKKGESLKKIAKIIGKITKTIDLVISTANKATTIV